MEILLPDKEFNITALKKAHGARIEHRQTTNEISKTVHQKLYIQKQKIMCQVDGNHLCCSKNSLISLYITLLYILKSHFQRLHNYFLRHSQIRVLYRMETNL